MGSRPLAESGSVRNWVLGRATGRSRGRGVTVGELRSRADGSKQRGGLEGSRGGDRPTIGRSPVKWAHAFALKQEDGREN